MAKARTLITLIGLALVGTPLGALAGVATGGAAALALTLRSGEAGWPFALFCVVGGAVGGVFGALLAPAVAFTPWRYIPVGRLFAGLALGTIVGGCAMALVLPNPVLALLGGIGGFLIAGDRLAARATFPTTNVPKPQPNAPAG